jgi:hypothetical protein
MIKTVINTYLTLNKQKLMKKLRIVDKSILINLKNKKYESNNDNEFSSIGKVINRNTGEDL